jgi:hypothetical protein
MDIFIFIKSINKIAVFAFFITFFFIAYEIYLLRKERKSEVRPVIPEFISTQKYGQLKTATTVSQKEEKIFYRKANPQIIMVLIILMCLFGGIFLIGTLVREKNINNNSSNSPSPLVKVVYSQGIKIFNDKWIDIPDGKLSSLRGGDKIFIGIKNILNIDTDKARIRINSVKWENKDETLELNNKYNLYYREYQIATGETKLTIDAQLHSQKEGWLGD